MVLQVEERFVLRLLRRPLVQQLQLRLWVLRGRIMVRQEGQSQCLQRQRCPLGSRFGKHRRKYTRVVVQQLRIILLFMRVTIKIIIIIIITVINTRYMKRSCKLRFLIRRVLRCESHVLSQLLRISAGNRTLLMRSKMRIQSIRILRITPSISCLKNPINRLWWMKNPCGSRFMRWMGS